MCSVQCTVHIIQCTLYSIHYTVYSVRCTLYSVEYIVNSVHRTLHTVFFTVRTLHYTVLNTQGIVCSELVLKGWAYFTSARITHASKDLETDFHAHQSNISLKAP